MSAHDLRDPQHRDITTVQPWMLELTQPSDGWLSANERLHWAQRSRRTRVLRRLAYLRARQAGCPELQAAHIVLWFRWRTAHRRDVANLAPTAKAIVDGLIDAHLLPDDDDSRLLGPDLRTGPSLRGAPRAQAPLVQVLVYPLALAAVSGTEAPAAGGAR